jgi:hypothetical protein
MLLLVTLALLTECGVMKDAAGDKEPEAAGMEGLMQQCMGSDTVHSILIKKAEAILTYDEERYEVNITLFSKKDSIIYLSAVNSGFEILRAAVEKDTITVIDRMNKIVYSTPLKRRFGYQYPVSFKDLENLIDRAYLCDTLSLGRDDLINSIVFDLDTEHIKKRIVLNRVGHAMRVFEFYHRKTDQYMMGERLEDAFKIYSNFMITDIEIIASGGERSFNKDVKIKMEVNPRKYTFTELR